MKHFDAIIIGFGKAGKTLASDLATHGYQVALIEKSSNMYGGTCINVGCIPTKSLVHSAKISQYKHIRTYEEQAQYYREAIVEKSRLTSMLRQKNFAKLAVSENITLFDGVGCFVSKNEISVISANHKTLISGNQIFINTGSMPILPAIPGIEDNPRI